jgi:hypothetical protein
MAAEASRIRAAAFAILVVVPLAGCGTSMSRLLSAGGTPRSTTTAVLQAMGPLVLTVSPAEGPAGSPFHFHLTGLAPSDVVTFSIAAKGGHPYTGPTHVPAPDGSVAATYETLTSDTTGQYVVLAHTARGRGVFASFQVDAPKP